MRRHLAFGLAVAATALIGLAVTPSAHATITFFDKNNPQPGEQNVLLNNGTTGPTVMGTTNQRGETVVFRRSAAITLPPARSRSV
jgi:hypothetical protein